MTSRRTGTVALLALLLGAPGGASAATNSIPADVFTDATGEPHNRYGASVAFDGNTIVVGSPHKNNGQGEVVVLSPAPYPYNWQETGHLKASDAVPGDGLGTSVAISGDTIVAGAPNADGGKGAVYTFTRNGPLKRTQTGKLTAALGVPGSLLGSAVSIDGGIIIGGAPGYNSARGIGYVFETKGAAQRNELSQLWPSPNESTATLLRFGSAVAIRGSQIIVSAPDARVGANPQQGKVYRYDRSGVAAAPFIFPSATYSAQYGAAGDELGTSIALGGDLIVAGSPHAIGERGAVFTFTTAATGNGNTELGRLSPVASVSGDHLGSSVATDGKLIAAGADGASLSSNGRLLQGTGRAYLFARSGDELVDLTWPGGGADAHTGASIALTGDRVLAGVPSYAGDGEPGIGATVDWKYTVAQTRARIKPRLTEHKVTPRTFALGSALPRLARAKKGATISFRLSEFARVKLVVSKRRGKRYVRVGTLTVGGRPGVNKIKFSGRLTRRVRLSAGTYRVTAEPTDTTRLKGKRKTAGFRIVRR